MNNDTRWILTDVANRTYVETLTLSAQDAGLPPGVDWRVTKQRLHGGLADGVDLVELSTKNFSVIISPTRGMGIWKGTLAETTLGWDSPARGPVHPAFVNRDELGGIGWLQGFDEWIVRCGLNNNGAPATDRLLDNTGAEQTMALPLHGKIANIPAHYVELRAETKPPYRVSLLGIVDEAMLFFPQLRLTSEVILTPNETKFTIKDEVTNLRSQPAEFELLYHCNFGPPILGEGARFRAPVERLAPINSVATSAIKTWDSFPAPTPGVIEQCYLMTLKSQKETGRSIAMLENAEGNTACALRFSTRQLPYFTLWKNPAALSDGYVTGLEPGTDFPNAKPFERAHGRVMTLPPGASHHIELEVDIAANKEKVAQLRDEVATIAGHAPPKIEHLPPDDWAPN